MRLVGVLFILSCFVSVHGAVGQSFFDLEARDLDGNLVKFSEFRGMVVIVVNVASQCGYTESHYRGLVRVWNELKEADAAVEILAFPCNQFGAQEPGSNEEIMEFVRQRKVEFRLMEKIEVNGPNTHPVYQFLKEHSGHGDIEWNFATYFVVGPDGFHVTAYDGINPRQLRHHAFAHLGSYHSRDEEL